MIAPSRAHAGVEETRTRILTAAREIFERNGTRGTTTREVAERAGVNEATLFRHFGSKAVLLAAMREESCAVEEFRETLAALDGTDIAADLRVMAAHAVETMHRRRSLLCVSLVEDAQGRDDVDSPEWRGPWQILELLSSYFAQRVAEGRLTGDPVLLARVFLGLQFQYVLARKLWASHTIDFSALDGIVDLFLNGARR